MTDDTTFWDINVPLVDNPSQLRVKRWSFSFRELLTDPTGVQHFMKFCESEFSGESLKFFLACQDIKQAPTSEIPTLANKIYKYLREFYFLKNQKSYFLPTSEFLSSEGGAEVNVNDSIKTRIGKKLTEPTRFEKWICLINKNWWLCVFVCCRCRDLFIEAEKHIFELMKKNSYSRYVLSDLYKEKLMHAAITAAKKR